MSNCATCGKALNFLTKGASYDGKDFCPSCGLEYSRATNPETHTVKPTQAPQPKVNLRALCPSCHSQNIVPIGQMRKNFSTGKAVGGAVLLGPVGLAAGLLGKSNKKLTFYCQDCGKQFKR